MSKWNVLIDDTGKKVRAGYVDFDVPVGWSVDSSRDEPDESIASEIQINAKATHDLEPCCAALKAIDASAIADADLKAVVEYLQLKLN